MSIGDNIRRLRIKHELSQKELAQIAGVTDKAVSTWELGIKVPRMGAIERLSEHFGIKKSDIIEDQPITLPASTPAGLATQPLHGKRIPVYGSIVAGIPIEAIEDIEDWEEIPQDWPGEFFALRVRGRSMEPKYVEGDTVILRRADDVESGRTAAVLIGRESATLKRVIKSREGVTLVAYNPDVYEPHFFSNDDVLSLPLQIIGDVIELRRKV
ncbi:MAG: helix-turn-helix domain-containing protein [Schwartzia sp.]|nr:helix-turn-helix domain-containing protein [Schwartzia sp. (in: firmicutes)]